MEECVFETALGDRRGLANLTGAHSLHGSHASSPKLDMNILMNDFP